MVGALVTFAGGVTLASTKRDVIFLIGVATWMILNSSHRGIKHGEGLVEEAAVAARNIAQTTGHSVSSAFKRFGRAVRIQTGSFLFMDAVSLATCVYVSTNKLPEKNNNKSLLIHFRQWPVLPFM